MEEEDGDVSDDDFAWRSRRMVEGENVRQKALRFPKSLSDSLLAPMYLTGTLSTSFSSVCLPGFRARSSWPSALIARRMHAGAELLAVVRLAGLSDVIERSRNLNQRALKIVAKMLTIVPAGLE